MNSFGRYEINIINIANPIMEVLSKHSVERLCQNHSGVYVRNNNVAQVKLLLEHQLKLEKQKQWNGYLCFGKLFAQVGMCAYFFVNVNFIYFFYYFFFLRRAFP